MTAGAGAAAVVAPGAAAVVEPGAGGDAAWFGNIADKSIIDHITAKGWHQHKTVQDGVAAIVKGHMNAEVLAGKHASQPIRPGKEAQDTDWNDYYTKIRGVNNPGEYKLDFKEGEHDKPMFEAAQKWFYDNGLDARQAGGVYKAWNDFQNTQFEGFIAQSTKDMQELAAEIPVKEFDNWTELSRRAAKYAMKEAGISNEGLAAIERVVGTKSFMKMFNKFGQMFKEGVAPGGGLDTTFQNTPEYAKAKIAELKGDADFMAKYTHDNPAIRNAAIDMMSNLQKQAHGDKAVT